MPCLLYHRRITIRKSFLTVFRDFSEYVQQGSVASLWCCSFEQYQRVLVRLSSEINYHQFLELLSYLGIKRPDSHHLNEARSHVHGPKLSIEELCRLSGLFYHKAD